MLQPSMYKTQAGRRLHADNTVHEPSLPARLLPGGCRWVEGINPFLHRSRCDRYGLPIAFLLLSVSIANAGLYYSGEQMNELPSQWRGFLLDQRMLRSIAVKATAKTPASLTRIEYEKNAAKLEQKAKTTPLTADEQADLGALYVRLGEVGKALSVLRDAQRQHPEHFRIAANLGTAWQMNGELEQAMLALRQAVQLAPEKSRQAEEYHLKLVQARLQKKGQQFDDLFGVSFDKGDYEPGKMNEVERKKLPAEAAAIAQQLALWLPVDGPLLWQLAELANAFGDVRTAAAMMDGCVTQFNMNDPDLRRHRQLTRAAADKLTKATVTANPEHQEKGHMGGAPVRSRRPLITKLDQTALPPISERGVNILPWELLAETEIDAKFRPTFAKYLADLDGKTVAINGFMQPLGEDLEVASFVFLEYPIGCWYCEMPEVKSMVFVTVPRGQTAAYERSLTRVVGRLTLNSNDPEDFLITIRDARVGEVD